MTAKKRKVAVFDVDGTIFRSSLLIELVEELIREKMFPEAARRIYDGVHRRWLNRSGSYEKYIRAVIAAFDHYIRGTSEKDFLAVVDRVLATHRHRVYRYTRDLVAELKRKDYFLLAISHSPKYIVGRFGTAMGFDKTYGILFELDSSGKFTGNRLHTDVILDKAKVLERAVFKENLTLAGSLGVGDTESDTAFLQLVDRPICFNPNAALYRVAKRRGWPVVVERKDVIYRIKKASIQRSMP